MLDRLRRHPFFTLLLLLLLFGGGTLAIFLYSFDLNNYRAQLQATLQSALHRPVRLGSIHFAVRHGLSLDITAAAIGEEGDATALRIEHLVLRLRIAPLLERRLSFSSVILDGAQLRIAGQAGREVPPGESPPEKIDDLVELLRRTAIDALIVRNGSVTLIDPRPGKGQSLGIGNLDLQLRNLAVSGPVSLTASGDLASGGTTIPWQLAGVVEPAGVDAPWQKVRSSLSLTLKGLKGEALAPLLTGVKGAPVQLRGSIDLVLHVDGAPASGLSFELRAKGRNATLALPALFAEPLPVREVVLGGIWQSGASGSIRDLLLRVDDLTIRGEVALPAATGAPLLATLSAPETPLARLGRLIPDRPLPLLAQTLRLPEVAGTVRTETLRFSWSQTQGVRLDAARVSLQQGRFRLKELGLIEGATLDLAWQDGTLDIRDARATLLGGTTVGQGSIIIPDRGEPVLDLTLHAQARAEALTPLLPPRWQEKLRASGEIALDAKLAGPPARLLLDLVAHFDATSLGYNGVVLKRAGEPGELLLLGTADRSALELSHARLRLPFGEARANGRLALAAGGGYALTCDIGNLALEKLPLILPVQRQLAGRGEVDLHFELRGDRNQLATLSGTGEFRKLRLHLWGAVADLRGGSGRMVLSREGIDFPAVSALVGLSPVRATASLKWLPDFRLVLDLDLPGARATDLVFTAPEERFESLTGRLVITTDTLHFERIAARIDAATSAVVNGRLDYHPPRLALDIEASRADIASLIGLWSGGKPRDAEAPAAEQQHPLAVEIAARVAAGTLYGIAFSDAAGTIAVRDQRLIIHPLRCRIGNGTATLQVVTGSLAAEHPLLKVSGHIEKLDATLLQREVQRRGSLSGTLESNFYIEGELGRYLPTCRGGINLRLDKGLMRGFTGISRALALFNVGKILTLNVPDIDREGLLFDRIAGSATIRQGVARTDNLTMTSSAFDMALIGSDDLVNDRLDFILAVKPLQTVDKVLSSIPLAGWILTGEKKALVTAQFRISGNAGDPQVEAIPLSSLSEMAIGILKRTLGLPGKVVDDVKELFK